jgi:threonine/homoserine/homoserine lactone efflux protein
MGCAVVMIDWMTFVRGAGLALLVAVPPGGNALLCVRRTLLHGWSAGLAHGFGAATAHACYAGAATFGVAALVGLLPGGRRWVGLLGGLLLCALGYRAWRSAPPTSAAPSRGLGLSAIYATGALFTLGNPITILTFIGAGVGVAGRSAAPFVAGAFLGSAAWWTAVSGATCLVGAGLSEASLRRAGRVSGVALGVLGLRALIVALW